MAKKKTKWKITTTRFIAYLDILGFKDKVMRSTHKKIHEELKQLSNIKKSLEKSSTLKANEDSEVYIVTFSDSIVIFSKNDSIEDFVHFLTSLAALFYLTIKEFKIPIKGSIAYGEISVSKSEQLYFGQPIIDAYLLEEDINYLGVVCHNTIDKYWNDRKKEIIKLFRKESRDGFGLKHYSAFLQCPTPLKSGKITHNNLDWFDLELEEEGEPITEYDLTSFYETVSGNARRYIDNTIEVFREYKKKRNKT